MKTFSPRPVKLIALTMSIGISVSLMGAISTGFAAQQAARLCVVELPAVTVHGKRISGENAVLADVKTSAPSSLPVRTKL